MPSIIDKFLAGGEIRRKNEQTQADLALRQQANQRQESQLGINQQDAQMRLQQDNTRRFFGNVNELKLLSGQGDWNGVMRVTQQIAQIDPRFAEGSEMITSQLASGDIAGAQRSIDNSYQLGLDNGLIDDPRLKDAELRKVGGAATTQGKNRKRLFEIIEDPNTPEYQKQAARIELNIEAPVRLSKDERVAKDKALGEAIATQKANEKFATASATSRQKHIDSGVKTIQSLRTSLSNFDKAIGFLDSGAGTGPINKMLPSFRAATLKLKSLQKTMGLDVVNSTTFGALSEKELELAQDIAIDMTLKPDDLKANLTERKAAQEKLYNYLMEQVDYLDSVEGASIPKFLRLQRRGLSGASSGQQTQPASQDGQQQNITVDF